MATTISVIGIAGCSSAGDAQSHPSSTHVAVQSVDPPHHEEDDPQWNCQLDGDRKCNHVPACWTEHKTSPDSDEYPDERLCGFADMAAPNSDGWVYGDYVHDTVVR